MLAKDTAHQSREVPHLGACLERAKEYIKRHHAHGLWPYFPGSQPATEASAWCAIAMRKDKGVATATLQALLQCRNGDGGWCTEPGLASSDWTSGPALLATRILGAEYFPNNIDREIKQSLEYMFDSRTEFYGSLARLLLLLIKGKAGLEYARGWPWSKETFHWIEPTTYALLALKIPAPPKASVYSEIIERANQFMVEHECKGGGWNHGSNFCLGVYLPPYIVTTAEALLSLQEAPESIAMQSGLKFLESKLPQECSAMEQAWSILALNALGRQTDRLSHALAQSQNPDGSFGINMMVTALSTIALDAALNGDNPLQYVRSVLPEPGRSNNVEPAK